MVIYILDSIRQALEKAKEKCGILIIIYIKDTLRMISSMEREE